MTRHILMRDLMERIRAAGRKCTLLGVGPVSKVVVRATMEACRDRSCPAIFIASRNQVDIKAAGYGYLMGGMDQKAFVGLLRDEAQRAGYDGPLYICRDHGGPWQRNAELDGRLPAQEAMEIAKASFMADIEAGFNYLHVDPTKCPLDFTRDDLCDWTVDLIGYCEGVRRELCLSPIDYEVGTEDIKGGLTTRETFEAFLRKLTDLLQAKDLPLPTCVVGQTGTLTRSDRNVGRFDKEATAALAAIAAKYHTGLKEHNGDYLSAATCRIHPDLGVSGMNVAPEFGLVQTEAYLALADLEGKLAREGWIADAAASNLRELLLEKAFAQSPWKKWMPAEVKSSTEKQIKKDAALRLLIARVCGHYVYDDPDVSQAIGRLVENINRHRLVGGGEGHSAEGHDAEGYVLGKVREAIEFYIANFRMTDLNALAE